MLTIKIFNHNFHHCLVNSKGSNNFIPYFVRKKLRVSSIKNLIKITQLEWTKDKVIGGLKYVIFSLDIDPLVHYIIEILLVYVLEAYGMLLSKDWSINLDGYFAFK